MSDERVVKTIGLAMAVIGSAISITGALINNLLLDHTLAMQIWRFSNFILLAWAFGMYKSWFNGGLSAAALCCMYAIFTITNEIGLR